MLSASAPNTVWTSLVISDSGFPQEASAIFKAGCGPTVSNLCFSGGSLSLPILAESTRPLRQHFHSKVKSSEYSSLCSTVSLEVGFLALIGTCLNAGCSPFANLTALLSVLMICRYVCEHNKRKIM